jgi:hypothetical protein
MCRLHEARPLLLHRAGDHARKISITRERQSTDSPETERSASDPEKGRSKKKALRLPSRLLSLEGGFSGGEMSIYLDA